MRNFSKKLAFVLAAAMVFTAFAPAAKADAAEKEMAMNRATQTLYVNEGLNHKGAETLPEGLYGNVSEYDFYVANKPANWKTEYTFEWSSSDEDVITVGKAGLATAVAVGKAQVICVVTDKATKVETKLTADVTVKANAADVVISNADEYEDFVVADERVIDLNRKMYAEGDKEGTSKRGVKVTDYTKWVAKFDDEVVTDKTIVDIDQATGKFTFGEAAPAGEYELYCYTYQSDKYNQATATSDPVVVTVEDAKNTFEAEQTSILGLTLKFDKAVEKLAKADVKVERVRERNGKDYFTKMTVKSVDLNATKDEAYVTLFNGMEDGNNYKVTVTGIEETDTFAATVGKPERIVVTAQVEGKDVDPLTTKKEAILNCKFYDANEVDVTAAGYKVTYSLVEYSKNGGYSLSGDKLTIKKAGELVGIKARYQGYLENGKMVGEIIETFYFTAEDPEPIYAVDVADFSLDGWPWYGAKKDLQLQDKNSYDLEIKVTTDDGKVHDNNGSGYKAGAKLPSSVGVDQTLSFTAVNPEICSVTSNGYLIPYKEGYAEFYANTVTPQNGKPALVEPFASFVVEVKANSKFQSFTLDKYDVSVGVVDTYDEASIKATAIDQHGNGFDGADKLDVKGVSENAKAILDVIKGNGGLVLPTAGGKEQTIKINGKEILDALKATKDYQVGEGDAAYLEFKAVIGTYEQYFNVLVQNEGNKNDRYVALDNNGTNGAMDALRVVTASDGNNNTENAKTLTFTAYLMSGNIKVGTNEFLEMPTDPTAVSQGKYYYKLTKDGQTVGHTYNGSSVSIALSGKADAVSGSVIAGKQVVNYNGTGAGTYTFELYICYADGELTLYDANTCVVTLGDKGTYDVMSQNKNEVDMTDSNYHELKSGEFSAVDKAAIAACFTFSGRDGKKIEDMSKVKYDVKYDATEGTSSVFVESVHFYEELIANSGEYVEYVVPVNTVLVRK